MNLDATSIGTLQTNHPSGGSPCDLDARRVLVVDDDDGVRRILERVVEQIGCTVDTATNGEHALEQLGARPYDLVITDLRMPKMDGIALVRTCRSRYPLTGIMVITGYGTIESAVETLKLGADDYLTKPLVVTTLAEKLTSYFASREQVGSSPNTSGIEPLVALGSILSGQLGLYDLVNAILDLIRRVMTPRTAQITVFGMDGEQDLTFVTGPRAESLGELGHADREWTADLADSQEPWYLGDGSAQIGSRSPAGCYLLVPLRAPDEVVGTLLLVRQGSDPSYTPADAQLLQVFGFQIGIAMLHARTRQRMLEAFRDLNRITVAAVRTLFAAIGTYDRYTHDHSERVSRQADRLAQAAGIAEQERETLRVAGLLHDIGKLGVQDSTLNKNDRLDESELDRVRLHPQMGARILADMPAFHDVIPLVRHHHEFWDGSGYPDGLRGSDIPLGARVIAIADSHDSMTSDRPYRRAMAPELACAQILSCAGTQFDPDLARIWFNITSESHRSPGD